MYSFQDGNCVFLCSQKLRIVPSSLRLTYLQRTIHSCLLITSFVFSKVYSQLLVHPWGFGSRCPNSGEVGFPMRTASLSCWLHVRSDVTFHLDLDAFPNPTKHTHTHKNKSWEAEYALVTPYPNTEHSYRTAGTFYLWRRLKTWKK